MQLGDQEDAILQQLAGGRELFVFNPSEVTYAVCGMKADRPFLADTPLGTSDYRAMIFSKDGVMTDCFKSIEMLYPTLSKADVETTFVVGEAARQLLQSCK